MARKIRAYQASIHSYLGMLTRGQEDERRRLARELHDDTVQALIALDQQAQMAQMALKKGAPDVGQRLAEVRRMTTALIGDIRRVVQALRPIYLEDLGLLPAMEMLVRETETMAGVKASFVTEGLALRLPAEREIAVYRIAQEALNNIARHAGAKTVQVSVLFEPGAFRLRIMDDGRGFAPSERIGAQAAVGHYGLMGMQERADLIGARLSIQSAPGQGTTVELRLPL
jgi:signal transduction histidine kinase